MTDADILDILESPEARSGVRTLMREQKWPDRQTHMVVQWMDRAVVI